MANIVLMTIAENKEMGDLLQAVRNTQVDQIEITAPRDF